MCSWTLSWKRIGPMLLTSASCRQYSFWCHLIDLLSMFLRCNGFFGISKLYWISLAADHQTVTMTLFWCKFGFGKCFGASSWSSHWVDHHLLSYTIHFLSHVTVWLRHGSSLLHRREDDASQWQYFWFVVNSRGTPLLSFFTFPVRFKCQMAMWSIWVLWQPSHTVARGSVSMVALSWSLSTFSGRPLHSSSSWLVCFAKFLEPPLHCVFVSSSQARCVVYVVSCLRCFMSHFELELKKIFRIYFLSNIISVV